MSIQAPIATGYPHVEGNMVYSITRNSPALCHDYFFQVEEFDITDTSATLLSKSAIIIL